MLTTKEILNLVKKKGTIKTSDFVGFGVSRQYIAKLIKKLVNQKELVKIGSTRTAFYTTEEYLHKNPTLSPNSYSKTLENKNLEEHKILADVERNFLASFHLAENIESIFEYSFSEMLNNAIEHSQSKKIRFIVRLDKNDLSFIVEDFGIGVFRNIMMKKNINNEFDAIGELLKGKATTAPKLHSGEGIFFTSKVGDKFVLDSFGFDMTVDNKLQDVFVKKVVGRKKGTKVQFSIDVKNKYHLNDIFKEYTIMDNDGDFGFDKTEIKVKLYAIGGVHISRSQARRILAGLEKFKVIIFDYDKVPTIGQSFADEIYRVFKNKMPDIEIREINMNDAVRFMVERAKNEAKKEK
jgi:anti-sigma regulatory factor (Ser/Thr protein kinase)